MKNIIIPASKEYSVLIGSDLIGNIGQHLTTLTKAEKIAIISDSNVWPLYGNSAKTSLENQGYSVIEYIFPAGEEQKNGNTYLSILGFLAENQITRSDLLIALGGGVVGDITGFTAATYLRGISYIQIPTTLLAMVDSSVGGKTAIDLPAGKNLVGAFYQPALVLCDIDALITLPDDVFLDGCAEVIKYGVLYDTELFAHLAKYGTAFEREYVIGRCVELKRNVVQADEFDRGERQKLNLGHTLGHGVEARSNFSVSHGKAVAIGMALVSKAACAQKLCPEQVHQSIINILNKFGLPITTIYSEDELFTSALSDKKRNGSSINLIVPIEIGNCIIQKTPIANLLSFIKAGL